MLQWLFKKKTVDAPNAQDVNVNSGSASEMTTDDRKVDNAITIASQHQSAGRYAEAEASVDVTSGDHDTRLSVPSTRAPTFVERCLRVDAVVR